MDADLRSIQQARELLRRAHAAYKQFATADQATVDRIVAAMVEAGAEAAERLGRMAHEETGFGRAESKRDKNLFATRTLARRMEGMKTAGIIRKTDSVWEVATPMGVVAALIPSTNPTATAMYKAILAAKARCGIVMTPHPRAKNCTAEALRVVAEAAYTAGAPEGLFGCLSDLTLEGTTELMENDLTAVILATGGPGMVRAAHSKGKPAYGVGSGNVPAYVDRSANLDKAAADLMTGTSFDWGTLCSTERSVVADQPIRAKLLDALRRHGGYVCSEEEAEKLRGVVTDRRGGLNIDIVGQSPARIAAMAGFRVPDDAKALIAEVTEIGNAEPLSKETLSPILSFYTVDGWQAGCARCTEILNFGGIGHTLAVHTQSDVVIEAFALEKPAMRIVVNTVAALGSVGMTTALFPAMTLGPGTIGGSITSDNLSPMHLLNVKRLAFETEPINTADASAGRAASKLTASKPTASRKTDSRSNGSTPSRSVSKPPASKPPASKSTASKPSASKPASGSWMEAVEARLLARAGNPASGPAPAEAKSAASKATASKATASKPTAPQPPSGSSAAASVLPLPDAQIEQLVRQFRK